MNKYTFFLLIVVIFNYLIINVLAENNYYVISIRRNIKDKEYDKSSELVQYEIDELVNDRMNDIYDVISNNKETYANEEGKIDEKLDELNDTINLKKRSNENTEVKFRFINKNRPHKNFKREFNSNSKEIYDYIPIESNLVVHICPVSNYYVIIAYLSEDIVKKIRSLPNVIGCTKYKQLKINNLRQYYSKENILKETHWKGLGIQEQKNNIKLINNHLAAISQGIYHQNSDALYDNNYYYPSSAGKDIDIFVIDDGLDTAFSEEDFDTYEGTPDERIIKCVGKFTEGVNNPVSDEKECKMEEAFYGANHGTIVSMLAAGTINGSAKKANLYMLSVNLTNYDILNALDYVKQNYKPNKTVVNISIGCSAGVEDEDCRDQPIQDKINELVDLGIIIIVAAGNEAMNRCNTQIFEGAEGVIAIGAINDDAVTAENIEDMYEMSTYSNFGECVVLFAPGAIRTPDIYESFGIVGESGTSFSSPLVAGVVATIMTDNADVQYNYELMKQKLIDLSIKDAIKNLDENTPNRLLNNGKRTVYPVPKCSDPSGDYKCGNESCSQYGFCVNPKDIDDYEYCLLENGCQSEFGYCTTNICGTENNRKCPEGECCTRNGLCLKIEEDEYDKCFMENGCLNDYSEFCFTYDISKINNYDDTYHDKILNSKCNKELSDHLHICDFTFQLSRVEPHDYEEHSKICDDYHNGDCTQFFKTPLEYTTVCKEIGYNIEFDTEDHNYMNTAELGAQALFCAKKDPDNFCMNTNDLFLDEYYIYSNEFYEDEVKEFCLYDECREGLIEYLRGVSDNFRSLGEETYKLPLSILEKSINYLISEECVSGNSSVKTTKASTTKTTKTKTSKTKTSKTKTSKTKTSKTKTSKTKTSKVKTSKTKTSRTLTTKIIKTTTKTTKITKTIKTTKATKTTRTKRI